MKRLLALALTTGVMTASCSGGMSHLLPGAGGPGAAASARGRAAQDVIVAPSGWAATATRGATISGGTDRGALAPATPLTVRVGLNLHNEDGLKSLIAARQKISPAQFASQYGPTPSDVQSVVSYLQGQGFTNVRTSAQLVSADGTAAQVSKAFNTSLESFQLGGAAVYVNTQPAFVPASLGGVVSAVLGLSNAAKMSVRPNATRPHASCFPAAAPTGQCTPAFDAKDVQAYYDAGSTPTGSATTIAVMAEGDVSGTVSDLTYAENKLGLPHVPVTVVKVGLPSPDTAGVVEWDLDTQSSTGMAQNVQALYIYATTSLSDSDIANEYSKWVGDNLAQLGNSSFGECEYQAFLDGAMKVDDHLFMQAAAQGQTMFVSTGDTGASCALAPTNGAPMSGPPMVEYPATSPYAVGVGGTTVVSNASDSSYAGEAAWNAGGGGLSQFENATDWQKRSQILPSGPAVTNLRGLPDIAMAADAFSGAYNVYGPNIPGVGDCSTGCAIGGTSEASPLAMGAYSRLMSAHGNALGFAAPQFYNNYVQHQNNATTVTGPPPTQALGGFHDIITGGNGAYTALPGYDYTTGLGTIDLTVMNAQIGT
ncbi:MAG: Pseudomonalisin/xanthomonalisin [Candidatus Eremiobacteraeota bacterium]|nr:Pseudomonalisin/xanthomonalisin [Candidatus Eremiobacteraeota bacterium]